MSEFDSRWDGVSVPREQWHFHKRLLERYGLILEQGEFEALDAMVKSGAAEFVRKGFHGTTYRIFFLRHDEVNGETLFMPIYVGVTNAGRIATALPSPRKRKPRLKVVHRSNRGRGRYRRQQHQPVHVILASLERDALAEVQQEKVGLMAAE